ncbi:hypothetical protein TSAR_004600 [Trichomalopsis sarcophagae]|uniref:LRRCT domain-containing protein n=1 Tax=Trichomalopsis sarcophagae TaxID=543379 RepID=A0A232EY02_9HYME|nr:hypothetical protein TSAR_004600 [Trichomalopsis sarcophagae]
MTENYQPWECANEARAVQQAECECSEPPGPRTDEVYRTFNIPERFMYPSELLLLELHSLVPHSRAEAIDCRVYNNLYLCLSGARLLNVAFDDAIAVQTIDDVELHLEDLRLDWISEVAFVDVANSSALYLRDNRLTNLARHFFRSLDQLTYLDLKDNCISHIEDGAFARLSSLETLLLDGNKLLTFEPGVWRGLAGLHELYATNNSIALKRGIFRGLRHLETLALDANNISDIPAGAFEGPRHLDLLYLSRNRISTFVPEVFQGLAELSELDLGSNRISHLPSEAFRFLASLEKLWLSGNQLAALRAPDFKGLSGLKKLYLNSNSLESVDMAAFHVFANVSVDPGLNINGALLRSFKGASELLRGYRQNEGSNPHPCYRSTSMDYGWFSPTVHTVPTTYYPRNGAFSLEVARGGMYRNCSLNTELDK